MLSGNRCERWKKGGERYQLKRAAAKIRRKGHETWANEVKAHGDLHERAEILSVDIIMTRSRGDVNDVVQDLVAVGVTIPQEVVCRLATHLAYNVRKVLSAEQFETVGHWVDAVFIWKDPDDAGILDLQEVVLRNLDSEIAET